MTDIAVLAASGKQALLNAGYKPMSVCRGNGIYSNDTAPMNRWDELFAAVIKAAADGSLIVEKKPLLKQTWVYCPELRDSYRGTELILYLCLDWPAV